jgi:hypothetical protein
MTGQLAFIASPLLLGGRFAVALGCSAACVLLVEASVVLILMVASAVGEALKGQTTAGVQKFNFYSVF